ncbi:glutamate--tRNA ligase, partial [Dapis sp. BLCC M172]|uniref:glutamate--tRNA ligase n=1 Tax=Dapis sp. BLCC M172 TaxID=2975281 RepID=UPI003CE910B1
MSVRVRLAPSPTGNLHIGTARTAVFNWLFAKNQKGKFILRIEDTDLERSRPEYTKNITEGLTWLGLEWDEGPSYQSQRLELYQKATQDLLDKGLAYRCYCTAAELEEMREAQKARKEAPRYDNRHRNLTAKQQAAFEAEGRQAVIRFKIDDDRIITWNDMVRGKVTWKGSDLGGDMVISRAAGGGKVGQPLYNMAVVVDDMDMKITHVIRGEDHIANTAKQILLYEALEGKMPEFGHTPLILNKEGRKLSKRDGVTSISDFQELGFTPEALANYMCLLGWTPPDATQEIFTLTEAGEKFSFARVNKAGAKFDWDKLDWINSQYLHNLPVEQLTDKLIPIWQKAGYELDPKGDRSWLEQLTALIGPSLTRLTDAVEMSKLFFSPTVELDEAATKQMQNEDSVKSINSLLEMINADVPLGANDAQQTIKKVTQKVKVKKGIVMRSLRASLTGAMQGPDLIQSWLLLHQKGFDVLRFKKSLGQEIEETKKVETTPNKSEVSGVVETAVAKSPALSKEETKTTKPPEQKQVTENKETKISTPVTPKTPTTGTAAKTSTEPKVEKESKVSTPVTPTTPKTPTTGTASKTPAEPKVEKESKVSTPVTPTTPKTPTTGTASKTPAEPKVEKESKVSTPVTPTTGAAGKTPAEPKVAKESKVSTPTTPTTGAAGKTPTEPKVEKESKVSTPVTQTTPTTPTTGTASKTPAEPKVAKESKVSTQTTPTTPTTGTASKTPTEPKVAKESKVSTQTTQTTPTTGAAAKTSTEPKVEKERKISASPSLGTPTTGAAGKTPSEPKVEKESKVSTPATPTTPTTGAAGKTPSEPKVEKES